MDTLSALVLGCVRCKVKGHIHYNFQPSDCSYKLHFSHADYKCSRQPFNPARTEFCESQSAIITEGFNNLLNAENPIFQPFAPLSELGLERCFSRAGMKIGRYY